MAIAVDSTLDLIRDKVEAGERLDFEDGLALLDDGTVWVAFWGEGLVRHLSPDGRVLDQVAVPAPSSSCPVLVGTDLLVITTAGGDPTAAPDPSAAGPGQVFAVRLPRTLGG